MTPEKLFDKIEAAILEEPKRINMNDWAFDPDTFKRRDLPACKTVGCIAGWACAIGLRLKGKKLWDRLPKLSAAATKLLALDAYERDTLFLSGDWPIEWQEKLNTRATGTKAYAQVVVDYIRWWRAENRPIANIAKPDKSDKSDIMSTSDPRRGGTGTKKAIAKGKKRT